MLNGNYILTPKKPTNACTCKNAHTYAQSLTHTHSYPTHTHTPSNHPPTHTQLY